jgi:hypothetical protein
VCRISQLRLNLIARRSLWHLFCWETDIPLDVLPLPDIGNFPIQKEKLPTRFRTASPQCYDKKYDVDEMLNNHQVECGRLLYANMGSG